VFGQQFPYPYQVSTPKLSLKFYKMEIVESYGVEELSLLLFMSGHVIHVKDGPRGYLSFSFLIQ